MYIRPTFCLLTAMYRALHSCSPCTIAGSSLSSLAMIQISSNRLLQKPIRELRANFGTISGTRLLQKEFILRAILAEDARDWSHFARPSVRFCLAPINTLLFEQTPLSLISICDKFFLFITSQDIINPLGKTMGCISTQLKLNYKII